MKLDCKPSVLKFLEQLTRDAPYTLKVDEPQFEFTLLSIWLGEELAATLLSALREVWQELVPKHAEDTSLVNAFWNELVCEVNSNCQKYLETPEALSSLVDNFSDAWKQPLSKFEAVYSIRNLELGGDPIALLGVEFFSPTHDALARRELPKEKIGWLSSREEKVSLAFVELEAAPTTNLFQAGRRQVIEALHLLRVAALRGLAHKLQADEFAQWELTGFCLTRSLTAGESHPWCEEMYRQFEPLVVDMGGTIQDGLRSLKVEHFNDLPIDIQSRLQRSIYWISHSLSHDSDDHRLVDLCTALEILLIPEGQSERNKGTVIALRYKLFKGHLNASAMKWLYDRRNHVVHGGALPAVGARDIWELRIVCCETIHNIVHSSNKQPDILTLRELIDTLYTEENLSSFIRYVPIGIREDSNLTKVVKEAESKLEQLKRRGN